jgi:DNA-binding Lrp family transcriptional regulator
VIEKFTVRLDRRAMGVNITAVIGVGTTTKFYRRVAEELASIYEVSEVYGTTAEFDLMVKVQAGSRDDLNRIVTHIRSMEGIDDIFITSVLEVFKEEPVYPRLKAD